MLTRIEVGSDGRKRTLGGQESTLSRVSDAIGSEVRDMADDKKPNVDTFVRRFTENYHALPEHLKYDIFKMYYNRMEKLDFEERTDTNKTRYKFLEKANNPVGKIMTENSSFKSAIFTRNMIMYYLMQLTQLDWLDPDTAEAMRNGLNGDNEFNQDVQDDIDF